MEKRRERNFLKVTTRVTVKLAHSENIQISINTNKTKFNTLFDTIIIQEISTSNKVQTIEHTRKDRKHTMSGSTYTRKTEKHTQ